MANATTTVPVLSFSEQIDALLAMVESQIKNTLKFYPESRLLLADLKARSQTLQQVAIIYTETVIWKDLADRRMAGEWKA